MFSKGPSKVPFPSNSKEAQKRSVRIVLNIGHGILLFSQTPDTNFSQGSHLHLKFSLKTIRKDIQCCDCYLRPPFQNWLAYDLLPEAWNFTEQGRLHFSGLGAPKKESNYAFCQVGKCDVY